MSSLVAAEKVLEGVNGSAAPAKLDEARKVLTDMKVPNSPWCKFGFVSRKC